MVRPYSTWESEGSSVVQAMVAVVWVIERALMLEIVGGVVSGEEMGMEQEAVEPPFKPVHDQR